MNREGEWRFPCGCVDVVKAVPPGHKEIRITFDLMTDEPIEKIDEYPEGGWECERVISCRTHTMSEYGLQKHYNGGPIVYCRKIDEHPKECNDARRFGD